MNTILPRVAIGPDLLRLCREILAFPFFTSRLFVNTNRFEMDAIRWVHIDHLNPASQLLLFIEARHDGQSLPE